MDKSFDFDAPQFINRWDNEPTNPDKFFDFKEEQERKNSSSMLNEAPPVVSSTTKAKTRRKTKVAFVEEKENVEEKYTLSHRLMTPKPANAAEARGRDEDDADNLFLHIEKLKIDSNKKSPPAKPARPTQVFEGITLMPTSEKRHSMKTRADSLTRTPLLQLRNRSILRAIESDQDETDDSMVSAISSTSTAATYEVYAEQSETVRPIYRHPQEHKDFGRFTLEPNETQYRLKRSSSHFSDDDFKKTEKQSQKFVALAEQIANFHKATPDRFRSKPLPWRPTMMKPALLGVPKSPMLKSKTRSRPVHYPGHQELEQRAYEEQLNPRSSDSDSVSSHGSFEFKIKANPINDKVMQGASLGLKAPVPVRPTTKFEPFKLSESRPKPVQEEAVFKFTAQPVPSRILEKPVGVPPKKVVPPTTPKTPAIVMPKRVRASPVSSKDSSPRRGSCESLQRTTVQPFSFEERDKMILAKKEQLIKKVLEEEKKGFSSFKAQPVRHYTLGTPTPMKAAEPVRSEVKPFNLTKPGQFTAAKQKPEEKVTFKAQPASVLKKRPFMPSHGAPTTPKFIPFNLKTEERVCERKKFEDELHKKNLIREKLNQQMREEEERLEQERMKELRKQAEFKAHPVPKTKVFELKESDVALTNPVSPNFHKKSSDKRE